jgi:hypothetical protein
MVSDRTNVSSVSATSNSPGARGTWKLPVTKFRVARMMILAVLV